MKIPYLRRQVWPFECLIYESGFQLLYKYFFIGDSLRWVSDYFKSLWSKNEQCTGDAWTHGDGRLLHQLTRLRPGAQAKLLMASSSTTTMTTWAAQAKATSPIRGQNTGYSKKLILSVKCFSASGKLRWIQTSILLSDCRWLDQ